MKLAKILKIAEQFEKDLKEDIEFSATDVPGKFNEVGEMPTYLPPKSMDITPTFFEKSKETSVPTGEEIDPMDPRTWKLQLESDFGDEVDMKNFDIYRDYLEHPPKAPKVPVINQLDSYKLDPKNPKYINPTEFDPSVPFEFEATAKIRQEFRKLLGIKK